MSKQKRPIYVDGKKQSKPAKVVKMTADERRKLQAQIEKDRR